jgi:hypothetical protein
MGMKFMEFIKALVALMVVCFIGIPGMAAGGFTNKLNLSANITNGNIASDVLIASDTPFSYNLTYYPSKVVYNEWTSAVANYDGYGAADGVILKSGDVSYDSWVDQIIFTDDADDLNVVGKILTGNGSDRIGVLQLFYYPIAAPSIEIFSAATLEAAKELGSVQISEYGDDNFAGHPGKTWKIKNSSNDRFFITGFARLNEHAIQAYTSDVESYAQMDKKMQFWGL